MTDPIVLKKAFYHVVSLLLCDRVAQRTHLREIRDRQAAAEQWRAHGKTYAALYRAAHVHKSDFYKWLKRTKHKDGSAIDVCLWRELNR